MGNFNQDIASCVIKNTQIIENASQVLSEISTDFLNSLSEYVKQYFKNDDNWFCDYTADDDDLCFGKKDWIINDDEKIGCFYLWYERESENSEYLTIVVGNTPKLLAFGFTSDKYKLAGMTVAQFKNFLSNKYKAESLDNQFSLSDDGKGIKILFKLSAAELATSYPNFEDSFDKITEVLDTIKNNIGKFDNIVNDLKTKIQNHKV